MLMRRNRRFGVRARSLNTSSPRARLAPSTPAVLQVSPHILRGDGQAREHGHMDEIEAGSVDRTCLHPPLMSLPPVARSTLVGWALGLFSLGISIMSHYDLNCRRSFTALGALAVLW